MLNPDHANYSRILVENDIHPVHKSLLCEDDDARLWIEEKMLELAHILGILMEGRMDDIRDCIREMISEEKGRDNATRSRKKQQGSRELVNLASSINYDRPSGPKRVEVKLVGK